MTKIELMKYNGTKLIELNKLLTRFRVNQSLTTRYMKYIVEIQLNTIDSYMRVVILYDNRNTMKMYYLFLGVTYLTMFQKCTIIFRSECSPEKFYQ